MLMYWFVPGLSSFEDKSDIPPPPRGNGGVSLIILLSVFLLLLLIIAQTCRKCKSWHCVFVRGTDKSVCLFVCV